MSKLVARSKINSLINAARASDLPAVFNGLRVADELMREEFISVLLEDTSTHERALQYLLQTPNPRLAVRSAIMIYTLAGSNDN